VQTGEPYSREYYRFARRGFHIEYFDGAAPDEPATRRATLPKSTAAETDRITHHLEAVVRQGEGNRFTVAQDVLGPAGRFWTDQNTRGLDDALRREVMRLVRTSEGKPGGVYRLAPRA
jgi:hypothetical protein